MDGNIKDEATKCLKIAKNSIKSGARTRAQKSLNKARKLDPAIETHESLSQLNEDKNPNEKPFNPVTSSEQVREIKRKRAHQVSVVREIERKKDYYEILGLGKNSSAEDIRTAYRKLSLKVHPDKNRAPGAEDSFKKLSKAFQCLSNEESRGKYDLETSSPANKCVRVSETTGSSVSRSRSSRIMECTIIMVSFGVNANVMFMFNPPWSMKTLMMMLRDRATMFIKLSGNFRLKYEYQGRMILLQEEDDLEADNELRTCILRLKSLGVFPMLISVEFI